MNVGNMFNFEMEKFEKFVVKTKKKKCKGVKRSRREVIKAKKQFLYSKDQ